MRIISVNAIRSFVAVHPNAQSTLQGWQRVIEQNQFLNWGQLKRTFRTVDKVGDLAVFNIGGNRFRLIAYIRFEAQILYVKAVLTHADYDRGSWKT